MWAARGIGGRKAVEGVGEDASCTGPSHTLNQSPDCRIEMAGRWQKVGRSSGTCSQGEVTGRLTH